MKRITKHIFLISQSIIGFCKVSFFLLVLVFLLQYCFVDSVNAEGVVLVKSEKTRNELNNVSSFNDSLIRSLMLMLYVKPDSARQIAAVWINKVESDEFNIKGRLFNVIALSYQMQANYSKAQENHFYALERAILNNDSTRMGNSYNNMGLANLDMGNYKSAYDYFLKALELYEELGQERNIASTRNNIGLLFRDMNNSDRARENLHQALAGFVAAGDSIGIASTLNNIGTTFMREEEYAKAYEYFQKAMDIAMITNYRIGVCVIYQGIAESLLARGYRDESIAKYWRSLEIATDINQPYQKAKINLGLARVYLKGGYTSDANEYATKALEFAFQIDNKVLEYECYQLLSEIFERSGDYYQSLMYFQKYNGLKEELLNQTTMHQVYNLEVSNLSQANALKELEIERQELIISKKNNLIVLLSLAFILLMLGLYLLYLNYRHRQHASFQQTIIKLTEKKTKAALEAEINERKRIGRELHDSLGQMLSATRLQISVMQQRKHLTDERRNQLLDAALYGLDEAFVELRNISHNLAPSLLSEKGLPEALKTLTDRINQSNQLQVELEMFGLNGSMDELIEHSLFRIVQELISNTIKHAQASKLAIQIIKNEKEITLMAEDDGCGFDPGNTAMNQGSGLSNIKTRAENLNCNLFIDSMPGRGTIVCIVIPLMLGADV